MTHTVGRVAELAKISVRTLHHYDALGLLAPSGRSEAGYRLYAAADLERLDRILLYRELGFDLGRIRALLDDEGTDPLEHLERQAHLLAERAERLEAMRHAVRLRMEALKMGVNLTPEERFEIFGHDDPTQHHQEAEERWGDSDAWQQSQQRTRRYGKAEWQRIKDEGEAIEQAFAEALAGGRDATDAAVLDVAERHRHMITRWFYDCSKDMHAALAGLYTEDPRFEAHYERRAAGLAAFVAQAVKANAERA